MKKSFIYRAIISMSVFLTFMIPTAFAQSGLVYDTKVPVHGCDGKDYALLKESHSCTDTTIHAINAAEKTDKVEMSFLKVREAEATKDINQKLALLEEAIKLNPNNDEAYISRAEVFKELDEKAMKQKNYGLVNYKVKAIEDVEKAVLLNPSANNYLRGSFVYSSVRYSIDKKDFDKIQKKYAKFLDEAIRRYPKEGSLYYERGALNVNNFDGSVNVDGDTVMYHKVFLEDNIHLGKPLSESQISDYMTFLELDPVFYTESVSLADMTLGDLFLSYRRGVKGIDLQRLASILDYLIEKNSAVPGLRLRRIALNKLLNRPEKSVGDYEKLTVIDSKNADAYYALLGNIYYQRKDYEKAIDYYNRSLRCAEYADVHKSRGNAYKMIGEHDKAQQDYRLASELEANEKAKHHLQDLKTN